MKRSFGLTALILAASLAATPASSEERGKPLLPSEEELRQLRRHAERLARELADRMSPLMQRLEELAKDLNAYEPPEMLPNGDIIIRRKRNQEGRKPEGPDGAEEASPDDQESIEL